MRKTKILATLGPASNSEEMIRRLVEAGADAFRVNFSHGTAEQRARLIEMIRTVARAIERFIPIVADIQGPKLRIGDVEGTIVLHTGDPFVVTTEEMMGTDERVSTPFSSLPAEVKPGDRILINDGLVELRVESIAGNDVRTHIVHGGPISSKKGMNFPDSELSIPAITEKDREDLRFAAEHKVDYVAASFIRRKEDILEIRDLLAKHGGKEIEIIAKLEKAQAIAALESILEVSDGVMVARGDLGVELPPEMVPIIQKEVLQQASAWGRLAITATQMLESMTANSRPTRAEASDVANAIFDGSDAVMLSAETASGAYPIEAVEMMARIAVTAEGNRQLHHYADRNPFHRSSELDEFTDAMAGAANYAADEIDARYIVAFTQSGFTARLMSKFRPTAPVLALTRSSWVARRMSLLYGVQPLVLAEAGETYEEIIDCVEKLLLEKKMVRSGDRIVILMGLPIYQRAKTNVLRVHRVQG